MGPSVIDLTTYRELQAAAGPEFVGELLDTFFEEAPGILAELRNARAEGSTERFRRAAHSLKSNGLTFGALALAGLARELELAGLHGDPEQGAQALNALDAAYGEAVAALRGLRHA